jgi:hypothetical protein
MADYTYGQLETLWTNAGGSKALAPLMAAIALAESGGNPQATNPDDNGGTQTSWGLWQISNGTHDQPAPGILTPMINAQQAVAKYQAQGLGAWGTYTSGDYRKYYQGATPASSLPQGGGGAQQADLTSFGSSGLGWSDWINALLGPLGWAGIAGQEAGNAASGDASGAAAVANTATSIGAIAEEIGGLFQALEWLFVPSHWVRIISFLTGLFLLVPGLRSLMTAGQGGGGDASLAIGILLITVAGGCLFIAFHNLPDDVKNLQSLLGWVTQSIREGKAADTATPTDTV